MKKEIVSPTEKPTPPSKQQPTPQAPPIPYKYFCLTCEGCPSVDAPTTKKKKKPGPASTSDKSKSCSHLDHPRRLLADIDAVKEHVAAHPGHKFQPVAHFLREHSVRLPDIAYDAKLGHRVRKAFKKAAMAGAVRTEAFVSRLTCKQCGEETANNLALFRHLREAHLKKERGGGGE